MDVVRAERVTDLQPRLLLAVAGVRALLVSGLAMVGSLWDPGDTGRRHLFVVVALGWLPFALAAFMLSDRRGSPVARFVAPVADLAALACVVALVPEWADVAMIASVPVVAVAALTWPLPQLWVLPVAATALVPGAALVSETSHPVGALLVVSLGSAAVVAMIALVRSRERAAMLDTQAQRGRVGVIVAHVPHPVVLTTAAGAVEAWNSAAEQTLHGASGLSVDAPCAAALGLHVGERPLQCLGRCELLDLCAAEPDGSVEVWRPLGDEGRRQPLFASASALLDARGDEAEVVHSLRDITRLKQADEAKTLFLATASHELKTPLTVITGFADMLLGRPDLDPVVRQQALEAVSTRARELARIVDRLLLSSRIESGRATVKVAPVDVADVVVDRVKALAAATGRFIETALEEVPAAAADRTALTTVVDHLLDNALKYSAAPGKTRVALTQDREELVLEIADEGVGMDEEAATHCFDKFWQADSSDSRTYGGTGIGLYIVRSLVESMGGTVGVSSVLGGGSVFTVRLARWTEPSATDAALPQQRAPEPSMIREFMRQIGVPTAGVSE
jgi:signal transduction histidine kinase